MEGSVSRNDRETSSHYKHPKESNITARHSAYTDLSIKITTLTVPVQEILESIEIQSRSRGVPVGDSKIPT